MVINNQIFNAELMDILLELKSQLNINGVALLHTIKDSGKDIMCSCPYHKNGQERKPSAGIRKSDGLLHCFTCNETHSLQEVISYCFGHTEDLLGMWGWKWLNKNFTTIQVEERKDVKIDLERNNISTKATMGNSKLDNTDNNKSVFVTEEELDKYRYYHPYWAKRGITEDWLIELFDLGYSPKEDMITFPVRDVNGNCLFVAKRSVKTKFFNYPKFAHKSVYGLYELYRTLFNGRGSAKINIKPIVMNMQGEIFVCESMIDCLLLWQAGYYAVALNGTGDKNSFEQLKDLPCRHIILTTDNDEAGQQARKRIKKNVKGKLFTEIDFPKGIKDVGECSREQIQNILDWEVF